MTTPTSTAGTAGRHTPQSCVQVQSLSFNVWGYASYLTYMLTLHAQKTLMDSCPMCCEDADTQRLEFNVLEDTGHMLII